jgi:hypothetical protein
MILQAEFSIQQAVSKIKDRTEKKIGNETFRSFIQKDTRQFPRAAPGNKPHH